MCTVIVSFEPESPVPVLLIGVRDEFLARPWIPPGHHWPQSPELIGGQDLQAGGTWLALRPSPPRVACVLNGQGEPADPEIRRSRGELPLLVAAGGVVAAAAGYDPFHLVGAEPGRVWLVSWDGIRLAEQELGPGLHFVVNRGLEAVEPGPEDMATRIAHFRPRLLAARRPLPKQGAGEMAEAWGEWLSIVDGDGLERSDPRAMILTRAFNGDLWGTSSVSLVALSRDGARYDFVDKNS